MSNSINREQLIDILEYIGSPKIINKEGKDDVQFCCTIHGQVSQIRVLAFLLKSKNSIVSPVMLLEILRGLYTSPYPTNLAL